MVENQKRKTMKKKKVKEKEKKVKEKKSRGFLNALKELLKG